MDLMQAWSRTPQSVLIIEDIHWIGTGSHDVEVIEPIWNQRNQLTGWTPPGRVRGVAMRRIAGAALR